ncbi:hypothetical protein KIN20_018335 [Parelaphostrongylus tenuis]|uniref:Uncharacterized protein n=1 Tax=Parelaphostrongylus tenuis TaxID=148309 RepID=A0AAD5N442_PARTN|nr:hypothetical protein KIN20_018335 [Parelaphostrongylus tenuis]
MVPLRSLSLPLKATSKGEIGESKVQHVGSSSDSTLKRNPGERDITQMDILEERIRKRSLIRESTFGGQKQSWNYRSEIVQQLGLDNKHRNIWLAYAVIIVFGFTAFVYVKSQVIASRKQEMEERQRIRREMKASGENDEKSASKNLAAVDS